MESPEKNPKVREQQGTPDQSGARFMQAQRLSRELQGTAPGATRLARHDVPD